MTYYNKQQLENSDATTGKISAIDGQLLKVIERVNDGFVALDKNWCYTYLNDKAVQLLQRENATDLIGKHIWTEFPEGIGQPFYQAYLKADETQQIVIFEQYYPPWHQWFENRIYPSTDGLTIYFTDITQRKIAEQSIHRINRVLTVLSGCNEALIRTTNEKELLTKVCDVITEKGQYPLVWIGFIKQNENKSISIAAQKGFNKCFNEGFLDGQAISWSNKESVSDPVSLAIRSGKLAVSKDLSTNTANIIGQHVVKEYAIVSSISLPIRVANTTYGILTIYSDSIDAFNTDETRLLQDLTDNLAFGITNLRIQIEQKKLQRQLQRSQKMEVIGQLTSGIAHDFNNTLACILGYTEIALRLCTQQSNTKLVEYLTKVQQAGNHARDIVKQLSAFSRNKNTTVTSIPLGPTVDETIKFLQSTLPTSINLQTDINVNLPEVMMDAVHLHQLVMNLCLNASDALDEKGDIKINIRLVNNIHTMCDSCHSEVDGNFVELSVMDTGKGLSTESIERIFDPFYTTKEIGKGTGMGLSMVHSITHDYNGHIRVETKPGKGCIFRLLFPASDKITPINETEKKKVINVQHKNINGHVLIIDDDEFVANFLTELLRLENYQVTMFTSSSKAFTEFELNPNNYDLVITDQTMPDLTGDELASKMLQLRSNIPIILCTGYSEKIDEKRAIALGIQHFMNKPVKSSALLESVARLLITSAHNETDMKPT